MKIGTFLLFSFLIAAVFIGVLPALGPHRTAAREGLTAKQWLEDLDSVLTLIETNHPDPFSRIPEERFYSTVESALAEIMKAGSDEQAATSIMRVLAVLDDAHTNYGLDNVPWFQRWFPVSFYRFSDGLFVTAIEGANAQYIGAQVLRVGQVEARDALDRVLSVMCADNAYRKLQHSVTMFSNGALLYGLGIIESPDVLPLLLRSSDGREVGLTLRSSEDKPEGYINGGSYWRVYSSAPVVHAFSNDQGTLPLHLRHMAVDSRNYWFTPIEEHRALFLQFNTVANQEGESFAAFRERLWDYADTHADNIDIFVLDIRYNGGGNGRMNLPFVHEIIKRDFLNRRGYFFTLIGRNTDSAALILMSLLNLHTETIFVGEPAGGSEFLFSNSHRYGPLPHSGIDISVATTYFNLGWPASKRYTFLPEYPAPFSSDDFFTGRDPALDAVLTGRVKPIENVLSERGVDGVVEYVKNLQYPWPYHSEEISSPIGERDINDLGYRLISENRLDDAIAIFELNTRLFPESFNTWDSLAEGYMNKGEQEKAVHYYKKSLSLNPGNINAKQILERLGAGQ